MSSPKITVALLRGGISAEREVSLASGQAVAQALDPKKFTVKEYDPKKDLPKLVKDRQKINLAFLALHGPGGEDGVIQGFLESLKIPYTGSDVYSSAVAMNKLTAKNLYKKNKLPIAPDQICKQPKSPFGYPVVVKIVSGGSSIGVAIVESEGNLKKFIKKYSNEKIFFEKFIQGTEISVGVLEKENGGIEALPSIEILPKQKFFDYQAKYDPKMRAEICPARLTKSRENKVKNLAIRAHEVLGCCHFSRTDMIITAGGKIFLLETNTLPGLTKNSLFPKEAQVAGISFEELCERLVRLALLSS